MKKKLFLSLLVSAVTVALSSPAFAADEYNVVNGVTLAGQPLGMHGVDPVSMFGGSEPQIGDAAYTSQHDGIDYYFASSEAQQRFDAAPETYLPQFGGFCAFGIYVGKKLDGDVRYADIVDGELFLFVNAAVFAKYKENREETLRKAKEVWPSIQHKAAGDL